MSVITDQIQDIKRIDSIEITANAAPVSTDVYSKVETDSKIVELAPATDISGKADLASPTFTGVVSGIDKTMVGLSNVDNTSDVNKPVSTAQQSAIDLKESITSNDTKLALKTDLTLISNIDNTSDLSKPISTAQALINDTISLPNVPLATLNKTFVQEETAEITLSSLRDNAIVSVVSEEPSLNKINSSWTANTNGTDYDVYDFALATTITPSDTTGDILFALGSGSFTTAQVGMRIKGNSGEAILTNEDGSATVITAFFNTTAIASGNWTMEGLSFDNNKIEASNYSVLIEGLPDNAEKAEIIHNSDANWQESVSIEVVGDNAFLFYSEDISQDMYVQKFDLLTHTAVGSPVIVINTTANGNFWIDRMSDGTFFCMWGPYYTIIDTDLNIIQAQATLSGSISTSAVKELNNGNMFVAYQNNSNYYIYFQIITPSGGSVVTETLVASGTYHRVHDIELLSNGNVIFTFPGNNTGYFAIYTELGGIVKSATYIISTYTNYHFAMFVLPNDTVRFMGFTNGSPYENMTALIDIAGTTTESSNNSIDSVFGGVQYEGTGSIVMSDGNMAMFNKDNESFVIIDSSKVVTNKGSSLGISRGGNFNRLAEYKSKILACSSSPIGYQVYDTNIPDAYNDSKVTLNASTNTVCQAIELDDGNIMSIYINGGSSAYVWMGINQPDGTQVQTHAGIATTYASSIITRKLNNGNIIILWLSSYTVYGMVYDQNGLPITSQTSLSSTNDASHLGADVNLETGEIIITYNLDANGYPAFKILNQAFAESVADVTLESVDGENRLHSVCALSDGRYFLVYGETAIDLKCTFVSSDGSFTTPEVLLIYVSLETSSCVELASGDIAVAGCGSTGSTLIILSSTGAVKSTNSLSSVMSYPTYAGNLVEIYPDILALRFESSGSQLGIFKIDGTGIALIPTEYNGNGYHPISVSNNKIHIGCADNITNYYKYGFINLTRFETLVNTDSYNSAITNTSAQINTNYWTDLNYIRPTDDVSAQEVYYTYSSDIKTTWKVIKSGGTQRDIVQDNAGTWQYNSNATYESTTWTNATTNNQHKAIEEAMSVSVNQMTSGQLANVNDSDMFELTTTLDFAIIIKTTDSSVVPSVSNIDISYDGNISYISASSGIDYTTEQIDGDTVLITSLKDATLKIEIN